VQPQLKIEGAPAIIDRPPVEHPAAIVRLSGEDVTNASSVSVCTPTAGGNVDPPHSRSSP
jgi:hypothetical protein